MTYTSLQLQVELDYMGFTRVIFHDMQPEPLYCLCLARGENDPIRQIMETLLVSRIVVRQKVIPND